MADDFVVKKLEEWDLQHAVPIFKAQKITQSVFKYLSRSDIDKMLFTIGEQLTFMSNFENYKMELQKTITVPSTSYNGSIWQMQDTAYHDDTNTSQPQLPEEEDSYFTTIPTEQLFLPETGEEKPPSRKRAKYLNWTLFELLESSLEGKLILAFHKKNQMLDGVMQKKLTYIVVSQLMETFNNSVPNKVFEQLAKDISKMFNGEVKQTWFSPSSSQQAYAKGKLVDHFSNRRRLYVQHGLFKRIRGRVAAQNSASEADLASSSEAGEDSSQNVVQPQPSSNGDHLDPLHEGEQPQRRQPQRKSMSITFIRPSCPSVAALK